MVYRWCRRHAKAAEMSVPLKIGMIVPSSNTTMETEVPEILHRRREMSAETFTFHSSRVRMRHVTEDELAAMVRDSDRCAIELADARVDAIAYACLVAIMTQGRGYHRESEARLAAITDRQGAPATIVSSAGRASPGACSARRGKVAMITPYLKPLTETRGRPTSTTQGSRSLTRSAFGSRKRPGGPARPDAPAGDRKSAAACDADAVILSRASRCGRCPRSRRRRLASASRSSRRRLPRSTTCSASCGSRRWRRAPASFSPAAGPTAAPPP